MKAILFGATGMVGQGVLQECLHSDVVESVLSIVRGTTGRVHPKLREITRRDFTAGESGHQRDFWYGRLTGEATSYNGFHAASWI